jgi:ATP-dependent RNA helicase DeaD
VRLFVSIGERDGAGPRDLVGAITGEAGVDGSKIGRIEVRDTFSIVEVQEPIAADVIRALNGITVRGRSVRADYDRGASSGRSTPAPRERGSGPGRGKRGDRAGRPKTDRPHQPDRKDSRE